MTTSIKREKLRDSGLGWVGPVPIHWAIVPTRAVLKLHRELVGDSWVDRQLLSLTKRGIVARDIDSGHGKYPSSFDTYQVVRSGNLVFCLFDVDETPRTVGLSELNGMVTGAYDCFVTSSNLNERFAMWYYIAIDDGKRFRPLYSGLRKVIPKPRFLSAGFALPPLDEQRQIAEYLDRETNKIDELITKQEQLVATLTERRQSFIDELIAKQTRGAGEGLTRVKHLYSVIDQRTGSPDLPLLSVSIHYGVRIRGEMTEDAPKSSDVSQYKVVRPNDIVINRMRAFQGALGCSPAAGVVSPDYMVLRPRGSVDPNWLAMVFRSSGFVGEMTSRLRGIGSTESGMIRTPRINVDDLGGIQIRVPALSEQTDLVETVTADVARNTAIGNTATSTIELLRERRAALISAAVTGKIDVRGL